MLSKAERQVANSVELKQFVPFIQLEVIYQGMKGEEAQHFREKKDELKLTFANMPKTYEQDGNGDDAIAHLHYFSGGLDWYITEKDKGDEDGNEQLQAFGLTKNGDEFEIGYIDITALQKIPMVEIDLHWKPKTLREIKGNK